MTRDGIAAEGGRGVPASATAFLFRARFGLLNTLFDDVAALVLATSPATVPVCPRREAPGCSPPAPPRTLSRVGVEPARRSGPCPGAPPSPLGPSASAGSLGAGAPGGGSRLGWSPSPVRSTAPSSSSPSSSSSSSIRRNHSSCSTEGSVGSSCSLGIRSSDEGSSSHSSSPGGRGLLAKQPRVVLSVSPSPKRWRELLLNLAVDLKGVFLVFVVTRLACEPLKRGRL